MSDQKLVKAAAKAMRITPTEKSKKPDRYEEVTVASVNADGSYQVLFDDNPTTPLKVKAGCTAGVGDRVLVCIMANGRCVAVARLGGDLGVFDNATVNDTLRVDGTLRLKNSHYISAETTDGGYKNILGMNSYGNVLLGYSLWSGGAGVMAIYGNEVRLYSKTGDIVSDGVVSVQAITAYPSASHSLKTSLSKVSLGTVYNESGTTEFMSLSNGGIKCTKDGKVLFSAYARFESVTDQDFCHLGVYRDDTQLASIFSARASGTTADVTIPPLLINVTAGSIVYLYAYNGTGARGTIAYSVRNCVTLQYVD